MTKRANLVHRARRACGAGLVTAIFLLVVLAGLGVAIVTVFTSQQASSNLDVQGTKAYQAARAGIEWGLFQQLRNGSCGGGSFALPADSTLSGFTVSVQCEAIKGPATADGDEDMLTRWRITAVACNQPVNGRCTGSAINNSEYVQRKLEVQI
jgi:MSHA biogenesis protein MshP